METLTTSWRATLEETVWKRIVSVDQRLLLGVRRWESALLTRLMKTFTHLGDTSTWMAVGLALALAGGEGPRQACLLGLGATLAVLGSQVLKRLCCRARPSCGIGGMGELVALTENPDAFSFPSGHTSAAFGIAVALAGEGSLGAAALTLASGIAVSRVYLGAHYPLDVAAGTLVGALAGLAARLLMDSAPLALLGYAILRLVP